MKKYVKRALGSIVLGLVLATVGLAGQAHADLFSGSSGSLAASASFTINGSGQLVVVLTNTSTADVLVPSDVLTAVFFSSNGTLTGVSAVISTGSMAINVASQPAGGVVGGEWAYGSALVGAPGGATQGISSSGFGLFGIANFPGPNLSPPPNGAVNGINYGILSAGDNTLTGNSPILTNPFVKNSVTFTFTPANGFTLSSINNVSFQYGTSLTEPNFHSVPEPSAVLLLGSGLVAVGLWRRFRKAA